VALHDHYFDIYIECASNKSADRRTWQEPTPLANPRPPSGIALQGDIQGWREGKVIGRYIGVVMIYT